MIQDAYVVHPCFSSLTARKAKIFASFIIALLPGVLAPTSLSGNSPAPKVYTQMLKSEPVSINGVEFIALAEAEWVVLSPNVGAEPIQIQLRITNRTQRDFIFPTYDTFEIIIRTSAGVEVPIGGGRDHKLHVRPVLIAQGDSYTLCRSAELKRQLDGSRKLVYQDGTGSVSTYGPLSTGAYSLTFRIRVHEAAQRVINRTDLPVWSGAGQTKSVHFKVDIR